VTIGKSLQLLAACVVDPVRCLNKTVPGPPRWSGHQQEAAVGGPLIATRQYTLAHERFGRQNYTFVSRSKIVLMNIRETAVRIRHRKRETRLGAAPLNIVERFVPEVVAGKDTLEG